MQHDFGPYWRVGHVSRRDSVPLMISIHTYHGMIFSITSRNSSHLFFFQQLYSISLKLSCFISSAFFLPIYHTFSLWARIKSAVP